MLYNLFGGNSMETSELKEKIKHRLEENKERRSHQNDPLPEELLEFDLKKARCGCSTDVIVVHCKEDEETH